MKSQVAGLIIGWLRSIKLDLVFSQTVIVMSTPMKVRAIGRGLVILSLMLLPLRLAVYLASKVLILAGYLGSVFLIAGILLWFVGAVMVGYTEQPPKKPQP